MTDPFQAFGLIKYWCEQGSRSSRFKSDTSRFQFDSASKKAKAIRSAFASKNNMPYAVGGEEKNLSRYHLFQNFSDLFRKKAEHAWFEFLLPHLLDAKPKPSKIPKVEGEDISSLQQRALQSIIRQKKIPVEAILELATPAPFGKGGETVFDKNVRNAFEIKADRIPPSLFKHDLPGNDNRISRAIEQAMKFNMNSKWVYKLYKMHIYGPGGLFLPHADTLHAPNHIATVVVGLPTEHEGGDLVVSHQGDKSTFNFRNETAEKTIYCAFFTDCTHEVKEVTSGYRIVLQYDVYEEIDTKEIDTKEIDTKKSDSDSESYSDESSICGHDKIVEGWCKYGAPENPRTNMFYSKNNESPEAAELAILDYFSDLKEGDNVALLLQYRYALPTLDAKLLKGSDAMVYRMFALSGRWKCTLQGLILRAETDIDGYWQGDVKIRPVSMKDFEGCDDSTGRSNKTRLVIYSSSKEAPGQSLMKSRYIEHTGNEPQAAKLAYYACCLILTPYNNGAQNGPIAQVRQNKAAP